MQFWFIQIDFQSIGKQLENKGVSMQEYICL